MFKKSLEDNFKKIFGIEKVSFALPAEDAKEQECLFVEIENARNGVKDKRVVSRVTGNCMIVGRASKIPFGFISKCVKRADPELTKDFFFFDFETNTKIYGDIIQMAFSFNYFYREQYDPDVGQITSVEISVEEH